MKTYTVISNKIVQSLKSADALRYTAITFTPRVDNKTDSTFSQIGEITGESERTIKNFVTRMKKSKLIPISQIVNKDGKRNVYTIKDPIENYKFINKCIFELPISVELKGFLIQLKSITLNNTDRCEWSINRITQALNCNRETVTKYIDDLIYLGYIQKIEKGYELTTNIFETSNQDERQD